MKFPLARYRYSFRMADALRLPANAGPLLRGQFGAALRQASCMTGARSCAGCMLRASCPYPAIFESPAPEQHALQRFSHVPNPYVLEPPPIGSAALARGQSLRFCLVLVGRALDHLELVNLALQRALDQGLGRERARGRLEAIEMEVPDAGSGWLPLWQVGDAAMAPHRHALPEVPAPAAAPPAAVQLRFHTPLRLQHEGRIVRAHALTPRKFVADLLRRASLLAEFHAGIPALVPELHALLRQAEALQHEGALRWSEGRRYSSRQHKEVPLDGLLGEWTWRGELGALLPWLQLGQWLHVGKSATMGLGGYRLHAPTAAPD